jgi:hypothetical protein
MAAPYRSHPTGHCVAGRHISLHCDKSHQLANSSVRCRQADALTIQCYPDHARLVRTFLSLSDNPLPRLPGQPRFRRVSSWHNRSVRFRQVRSDPCPIASTSLLGANPVPAPFRQATSIPIASVDYSRHFDPPQVCADYSYPAISCQSRPRPTTPPKSTAFDSIPTSQIMSFPVETDRPGQILADRTDKPGHVLSVRIDYSGQYDPSPVDKPGHNNSAITMPTSQLRTDSIHLDKPKRVLSSRFSTTSQFLS